jgi:hypothetical protein
VVPNLYHHKSHEALPPLAGWESGLQHGLRDRTRSGSWKTELGLQTNPCIGKKNRGTREMHIYATRTTQIVTPKLRLLRHFQKPTEA